MTSTPDKDYKFFVSQLPQLRKNHLNKYVVVSNESIEGIYDSSDDALSAGAEKFGLGHFLVQEVMEDTDTKMFFSYRTRFA